MKVFNLCAKVTKRHLVSLGVYLGIFAVLAVMLTAFNNTSQSLSFEAVRPSAAIVNRDGESALVRGLEDFLAGYADMVKLEDDREALQDARFFDAVDYILIIPQGFAKDFSQGGGTLEKNTRFTSAEGRYADLLVNRYLSAARAYRQAAPELSEEELLEAVKAEVEKKSFLESQPIDESFQVYFRTLPYIMMAVLILAVTTVMMVFNKPDLRMRNLCAPVKLRHVNLQLALYNVCLGGVAWLVLCAMAFLFYGGRIQGTDVRLVLLILLNSICYLFVCLSVAFLLGNFVKDGGGQNIAANFISLGLSFLGGSFVPLELLGDSVLQVARYTPSYWYNHAVEAISGLVRFDSQALGPVFISMAIQTGFAAAVFSVALVISKFRRQRTEGFASVKTEMA